MPDQHLEHLNKVKENERQKRHRSNETEEEKVERLAKQAKRQAQIREKETEQQKNNRLSKQAGYQTQRRLEESPQETVGRKLKDVRWHAKKRENETRMETANRLNYQAEYYLTHGDYVRHYHEKPCGPDKNPYTEKEKRYYNRLPWERDKELWGSSIYMYLLKSAKENLEDGDWTWIKDQRTNKGCKASKFEILSKKFALIFSELGISKHDVVHFMTKNEMITYCALGGLWILGAIGSLGNKYKWASSQIEVELDASQITYHQKYGVS